MQVNASRQASGSLAGWRHILVQGIGLLAVLLAGSALVFWVAANWPQMGPQSRLWLAHGVLAMGVLLAAGLSLRSSRWAGLWAGFAALASGALLALVGQIYQTGADRWQMFLLWAVLITPWVVLLRTVFLVLLWVFLLNLTLWVWVDGWLMSSDWLWLGFGLPLDVPALLLLNAILLVCAESLRGFFHDSWNLVRRVLVLLILGWAFVFALQGAWSADETGWMLAAVSSMLPTALLVVLYRRWHTDLGVVALSLLAGIGQIGVLLLNDLDSMAGVLLVPLLLLGLMWLAVRYVLQLQRAGRSHMPVQPEASSSWYLILLRLGALIPAVLLLGLWLAFNFDLESIAEMLGVGLVLLLFGMGLVRWVGWGEEVGAVLTVLGLLLCVATVLFLMDGPSDRDWRLPVLLLSGGAAYVLVPQFAVRLIAAGWVLAAGFWISGASDLVFSADGNYAGAASAWLAMRLCWALFAGGGVWALAMFSESHRTGIGQPGWWWPLAWALMGMAGAMALFMQISVQEAFLAWPWMGQLALLMCAVLPGLLLAAWMFGVGAVLPLGWRVGVPLAVCLAGLGWLMMPALSVALVWLVLGRLSGRRSLQVLAVPLGWAGLFFYYQVAADGLTLVDKSVVLGAMGLWLAGLAWVLQRWPQVVGVNKPATESIAGAGLPPSLAWARYRALGVLAGGILILGLAQAQIMHYKAILADGRPVVLALVPVDPRSLIQGDYMALDYAVRQSANDWLRSQAADQHAGRGWLLLRPDAQGVWQLQQVLVANSALSDASAGQLADQLPDSVALAVRWTDAGMDFGASHWFFPEGQGDRYAAARYGLLRVADGGTALLAGLLDKNQQPL